MITYGHYFGPYFNGRDDRAPKLTRKSRIGRGFHPKKGKR